MKTVNHIVTQEAILIETINCMLQNKQSIESTIEILEDEVEVYEIDAYTIKALFKTNENKYILYLNQDCTRVNQMIIDEY